MTMVPATERHGVQLISLAKSKIKINFMQIDDFFDKIFIHEHSTDG